MTRHSLPNTTKNHYTFLRYLTRLSSLVNNRNQIPTSLLIFLANHLFAHHSEITVRHLIHSGLIIQKKAGKGFCFYVDREKMALLIPSSLPGENSIIFPDRSLKALAGFWKAGIRSFNTSHTNTPESIRSRKPKTGKKEIGFKEASNRDEQRALVQAQTLVNHIFLETISQGPLNHELSRAVVSLGFENKGNATGRRQSWKHLHLITSTKRVNEAGHRWWVTEHGKKFAADSGLKPSISQAQARQMIKDFPPVKPAYHRSRKKT
jgi:hypothetical protein